MFEVAFNFDFVHLDTPVAENNGISPFWFISNFLYSIGDSAIDLFLFLTLNLPDMYSLHDS